MFPSNSRIQPPNRKVSGFSNDASEQFKTYPAPIMGWVTNRNSLVSDKNSAVVLDNFFPNERGISPRGGITKFLDIPSKCEFLFEYDDGGSVDYFAATSSAVYKFGNGNSGDSITASEFSGQTSSDYSHVNIVNAGGTYLKLVNGSDSERMYNGSSWSLPSITGVSTANLSHIWLYGNRAFYIEKDTMSAWYLGVDAIQGAATELPLSSIFRNGGSLLFGATFSTDTGEGIDDLCVFVTTKGEVALYSGDPSQSSWDKKGVYYIGEPIGKNAIFYVGGDPVIATKEGLIPLSSIINKDRNQAKLDSLSFDIEDVYGYEVLNSGAFSRWIISKWGTRDKLLIAPPVNSNLGKGYAFVKNLKTGAWCRYTGWDIQSMAVMGDILWIGDANGNIFKADVGGKDDQAPFECRVAYSFDNMGSHGRFKEVTRIKDTWRWRNKFFTKKTVASDYVTKFSSPPNTSNIDPYLEGAWDVSPWDTTPWSENSRNEYKIQEKWGNVCGMGESLSIQMQVVSGGTSKLDIELISVDLGFRIGQNLV